MGLNIASVLIIIALVGIFAILIYFKSKLTHGTASIEDKMNEDEIEESAEKIDCFLTGRRN